MCGLAAHNGNFAKVHSASCNKVCCLLLFLVPASRSGLLPCTFFFRSPLHPERTPPRRQRSSAARFAADIRPLRAPERAGGGPRRDDVPGTRLTRRSTYPTIFWVSAPSACRRSVASSCRSLRIRRRAHSRIRKSGFRMSGMGACSPSATVDWLQKVSQRLFTEFAWSKRRQTH
ncbi:hypothetical protein BV20DRAFT_620273 [Pilatotrama ljubarskyi]|nr:hypothetical protein BV20DRAFT_620273 [Pilatotrama ljubarskyi]